MAADYLFVSDCHLDPGRPEISAQLTRFLDEHGAGAGHLYILGDLFEVWLGDDDPAAMAQPAVDALRRLASSIPVYFMAGNRDFLVGQTFAASTGVTLLDEPHRLQLGAQQVVLIHGDTLCTDDHDYQQFRAMVRDPAWQAEFLGQSLAERQRIAARLRSGSIDAMAQKSEQIMDVNPQAVTDCFVKYQADTIVHGHTHRPAVHLYEQKRTRYVLGDWNPGPSFLSWDRQQGFRLVDPRV